MNAAWTPIFDRLASIRREMSSMSQLADQQPGATGSQHLGIDLVLRDLLLVAARRAWPVPEADRKAASKERSLPMLTRLAEQCAPATVSRPLLARIRTVHHRIRNEIEHEGYQVTQGETLAYLEAAESIAYAIAEPDLPSPPPDPVAELPGHEILGTFEMTRGQGPHPWFVVHAVRHAATFDESGFPLPEYYKEHVLAFWKLEDGGWELSTLHSLGPVYYATVEKIFTRSTADEELMVWHRAGESMGVMGYYVFAVSESGVQRLLGRPAQSGAYVVTRGGVVEEHAGDRITRYEWDGTAYAAQRIVRHPPAALDVIDIHYSVRDGKATGPSQVLVQPGQVFRLLRDDFEEVIVRTLWSADGVIELTEIPGDTAYQAIKIGETRITLIPHVYGWNDALEITVQVGSESR